MSDLLDDIRAYGELLDDDIEAPLPGVARGARFETDLAKVSRPLALVGGNVWSLSFGAAAVLLVGVAITLAVSLGTAPVDQPVPTTIVPPELGVDSTVPATLPEVPEDLPLPEGIGAFETGPFDQIESDTGHLSWVRLAARSRGWPMVHLGPEGYVATGLTSVFVSEDGLAWTEVEDSGLEGFASVFMSGRWALGLMDDGPDVVGTFLWFDGDRWVVRGAGLTGGIEIEARVAAYGSRVLLGGSSDGTIAIGTEDGTVKTAKSPADGGVRRWSAVGFGGQVVMAGRPPEGGPLEVWASLDGEAWQPVSIPTELQRNGLGRTGTRLEVVDDLLVVRSYLAGTGLVQAAFATTRDWSWEEIERQDPRFGFTRPGGGGITRPFQDGWVGFDDDVPTTDGSPQTVVRLGNSRGEWTDVASISPSDAHVFVGGGTVGTAGELVFYSHLSSELSELWIGVAAP